MPELQAAALQSDVSLYPAAILAVAGERMLPGGKLYPDLMGAAGVQSDACKARVPCCFQDAVFQNGFPHALARAADREHPAPAAVLEQPVPQGAFGGQCFVRPACNDMIKSTEPRPPESNPKASMIIDFPAPVSPVRTVIWL